ncbi:hypothetical protein GQ44DRAFT_828902 [Phaeosphaeriaceae sp. PMI808]|nr:hypothetical protein GQ44DRAFT_828902 [Phaeosphaeriaceae sp. PMI808]
MATAGGGPPAPFNKYYAVIPIDGKGYGCVALKFIKRGTRILADQPLLAIPTWHYLQSDIQQAFDQLSEDEKKLYFSLHSSHGQNPKLWPSRIHESVGTREKQRISEQHNARVSKDASLISIFQTNCMDMGKGAGVFPNAARFNHSCNPNAFFSWNAAIGKETIHMMSDIKGGEEITLSYCDMMHDRAARAYELKHYGIVCACKACVGLENYDESTYAYQSGVRRYRLQELESETRPHRGMNLPSRVGDREFVMKLLEMAILHREEEEFSPRLANVFLDVALLCEFAGDFSMAMMSATKAVGIKKNCQGEDFPDYHQYVMIMDRIRTKGAQKQASSQ